VAWIDGLVVEERAAARHSGSPAKHLGDRGELLEPDEIRDVAVLLRGARGVERRDRGRRSRWEDRAGLDELRAVVAPGAVEKRGEEGNVARGTQRAQLAETEAIGEDDEDVPHPLKADPTESTKRQRLRGVVGHRRRILGGVERLSELEGFFDGKKVVKTGALLVAGGELGGGGSERALPKDGGKMVNPGAASRSPASSTVTRT